MAMHRILIPFPLDTMRWLRREAGRRAQTRRRAGHESRPSVAEVVRDAVHRMMSDPRAKEG